MHAIIHLNSLVCSTACIKEFVGTFEVSIAFDDSCGRLSSCARSDIRVYVRSTGRDVTDELFGDTPIRGTIENLIMVYNRLRFIDELSN